MKDDKGNPMETKTMAVRHVAFRDAQVGRVYLYEFLKGRQLVQIMKTRTEGGDGLWSVGVNTHEIAYIAPYEVDSLFELVPNV